MSGIQEVIDKKRQMSQTIPVHFDKLNSVEDITHALLQMHTTS
jgi:hypothetical protein